MLRDGEPHLDRISLSDGSLTPGTQAPGDPATDTNPWSARTLIVDDTAVVSLRHIGLVSDRNVRTMVHGFDLSDLSLNWSEDYERRNSTANAGAAALTATDSIVAHNAGLGKLYTLGLTDGNPTGWFGNVEIRELGANATPNILADSAGNLYVAASRDAGTVMRLSATGQEQWRFSSNALELETGIAPGTDAQLALIDGDGTLYLTNEGRMFAIDSCGGLADCELPFDDVEEHRNVHAVAICRLVQLEFTGGTTPTTYSPRDNVSRAQMASFLARALALGPIEDPDADAFPDVNPNNVHTRRIYAVRDAGITTGLTPTTFGPNTDVRRDQMASLIIRLVDYLDEQG